MAKSTSLPMRNRKPIGRLTSGGLWAYSYGKAPHVVTVRENRAPGAPLVWDFAGERARSLGETIRVRESDERGGWRWNLEAVERAEAKAKERHHHRALQVAKEDAYALAIRGELAEHAEWLKTIVRDDVPAHRIQAQIDRLAQRLSDIPRGGATGLITVEEGFAMYHDARSGGVPTSKVARTQHRVARQLWVRELRDPRTGASLPWNDVTLAHIEAVATRFKGLGQVPKGSRMVEILRAVHNWLRKKRRMRGLESPTEGFDFQAYWEGYEVNRPRYTADEMRRLLEVRDRVDPRFALMLVLARFSGDRGKAYRILMRSAVDAPLSAAPSKEQAPHGWLRLPSLKGGDAVTIFLTARQRTEIERALAGYLRQLEARYREEGVDYPLFPAAHLRAGWQQEPIPLDRKKLDRPISEGQAFAWLVKAEELAGIPHVEQRGWHGIRRRAADDQLDAVGLEAASAARGWRNDEMLRNVYADREQNAARARVRDAMEGIE